MKRAIATVMSMALCAALGGCGGAGSTSTTVSEDTTSSTVSSAVSETEEPSKEKSESSNDSPDIEGTIDYEITQGVDSYGDSSLMLTYTNNTNHPIVGADFFFDLKKDMSDVEKELLSELQDETDINDDDLKNAYFSSSNSYYTEPGETAKPDAYLFRLNTINNLDYESLMGEEQIEITYIAGGKFYSVYYNSKLQTYSSPSPKGNAFGWFTCENGKAIPALDGLPTKISYDEDSYGYAHIFNVPIETYESYVETCKEAGYSTVIYDLGSGISLRNGDGVELSMSYDSTSNSMTIDYLGPSIN